MNKHRAHTISLLTLLLVVGLPTGIVLDEYHHVEENRALLAAVKADLIPPESDTWRSNDG